MAVKHRSQQLILAVFGSLLLAALIAVAVHPSLETALAVFVLGTQLGVLLWMARRARP